MISAHTLLARSSAQASAQSTPAVSPLPPAFEEALVDFGLMPAFRGCSRERQRDYVSWVANSPSRDVERDRIADILDELSFGSAFYASSYWDQS
jgi:hypothetical protein